jgi:hypothetical protein
MRAASAAIPGHDDALDDRTVVQGVQTRMWHDGGNTAQIQKRETKDKIDGGLCGARGG